METDITCKILILGESKVGKSSIMNRFCNKKFSTTLPPTLGIDYKIEIVEVNGKKVKL